MLATKKIWERPKLIILERGRPEELVLVACKMSGQQTNSRNKQIGCATTTKQCEQNLCLANSPS
jgi:hypothetical protein